jgi:2-keto-3-deoxy-L-rhamnonate aldolase RhmA
MKKALQRGQVVIGGSVSQLKGPVIPLLYASAGFQFIYIDMQHSGYTVEDILDFVIGSKAAGIDNLVRIPSLDPSLITRLLDSGVEGIMVPELRTPDEVVRAVKAVKYPPEGERSIVLRRLHTDFEKPNAVDMARDSNAQTLIVIQIENQSALSHVEEISRIPGGDALFVGPNDLSQSLGHLGQTDHPEVSAAIEKIIEVSLRAKIAAGMTLPLDLRNAEKWVREGLKLISYANDIELIVGGASQGVRKITEILEIPHSTNPTPQP